jgi:hypothetical protein
MAESPRTPFQVVGWVDRLGGTVERHREFFTWLGNLETTRLESRIGATPIERPIYVSGLARAGTTILLELLARHPAVATHQYRDYPLVHLPYWWNRLLTRIEKPVKPVERAHGDRIMVTPASPEAMEEVIWMTFFPEAHDPAHSNVLDRASDNADFADFYRAHIAKLLLARGRTRYLAKGNYNISRLAFIQKILPDARFVVPVRGPEAHIVSLMRQHRRFCEGAEGDPRVRDHLRRTGHFEFGPDRRPINLGNPEAAREVSELWACGEEVRGWARYWRQIYDHVAERLAEDEALAAATLVLRYEALCSAPAEELARLFAHVGLDDAAALIAEQAAVLRPPDYYSSPLDDKDRAIIREETEATAARYGYEALRAQASSG